MAMLSASRSTSTAARPVPAGPKAVPALTRRVARSGLSHATRRPLQVVASAVGEDQKIKAAEARWESQIRSGKVRNVSGPDAAQMMKEGWVLLDVRPPEEIQKAKIIGAVEVPVYVVDPDNSLGGLLKKATAFGMGGWWLGGDHMIPNKNFLAEVQAKVPKDAGLLVGCQKGLRSLAACEQLSRSGYANVAWVNGGFDTCKKGDIPTQDNIDPRYAGIGGLSELIGWTEVQQEEGKNIGSVWGVLGIFAALLVADLLLFAYEQITYMKSQNLL